MQADHSRLYALCLFLLTIIGGCVDPYRPPEIAAPNRYLVVDGSLNGGAGASTIRLSRTRNIDDVKSPTAEQKAQVRVESESGTGYVFTEGTNGVYTLASPSLPFGQRYRVRIKTTDGNEYLSDLITIKQTPKIDSVSWEVQNSGIQIYVNTHDPANKTRYYRWDFEDTYEIITPYRSLYEYTNRQIIPRVVNNIDHCWRTESSTSILIGSTTQLTQDIVQRAPLLFVPGYSPKTRIKYSVLVRQYAQSAESYTYWLNLRKNTEQLGSLFDPLPSQLSGNIHNVKNPSEPVMGFLDGYSTEQVRVFINRPAALPYNQIVSGYEYCKLDTIPFPMTTLESLLTPGGGYNVVDRQEERMNFIYFGTYVPCTDCRSIGSTTKPSYWP